MAENLEHFCIKIILNHLEKLYIMYFSSCCCTHMCSEYLWYIYCQPIQPNKDFKKKNIFHIFRSESKGFIYKKGHNFFPQCFRQSRPLIQWSSMSKLIEKTQRKSRAGRVRSNPFYWAFEPVGPRLGSLQLPWLHSVLILLPWHGNTHTHK